MTSEETEGPYPPFRPQQEVRLAVVMYGGVSLAIYIHGVAQELFSLVRATAPEQPFRAAVDSPEVGGKGRRALLSADDEAPPERRLRGAERVYRKLGQLLTPAGGPPPGDPAPGDPIRTRFVVDILSGTSAGGINGIFLAKALAAQRSMEALKELWVDEGDLAKLINDRRSYADEVGDLAGQDPPESLLNSRRMYAKLLLALARMDAGQPEVATPYVDELDLFVTATDIAGLIVDVPAGDAMVSERRHKNVFHFRYPGGEGENGAKAGDFAPDVNPFLAFAARCTSSFPFAFEPMSLGDIDEVLSLSAFRRPEFGDLPRADHAAWRRFYEDYLKTDDRLGEEERRAARERLAERFRATAFGDGGYLDNKPFTHALGALRRRRSDFPVDRKLVYVEPAPEHPDRDRRREGKPDALENVLAALLVLPRAETIREDLEQVRELNRLVDRVGVVLGGRDRDSPHWGRARARRQVAALKSGVLWRDEDLGDMLRRYGLAYGAYHRLKVADVTDRLAAMVSAAAGFPEESSERQAVRYLIGAWRSATYELYHPEEGERRPSENTFLFEFDLWWRLRRLAFLRNRADDLYALDLDDARARIAGLREIPRRRALAARLGRKGGLEEFRHALLMIKWGLSYAQLELAQAADRLASPARTGAFAEAVRALPIGQSELLVVLAETTDEDRREQAEEIVAGSLQGAFDRLARVLREELAAILRRAAHHCQTILGGEREHAGDGEEGSAAVVRILAHLEAACPDLAPVAQAVLGHYYRYFEEYDMVSFPVVYETGVGEIDQVEVVRISPEDAVHLFDGESRRTSEEERQAGAGDRVAAGRKRSKLAGTLLSNFGAFLAERWRVNDMLWGRLDAAERLITALLPADRRRREELIEEAQVEILAEELGREPNREAARVLAEAVDRAAAAGSGGGAGDGLAEVMREFAGEVRGPQLERLLSACLRHDRLGAFFVESSQAGRDLPPQATLESAARATEVVGKMLESLAAARPAVSSAGPWLRLVTWLGRLFWGLVEVAVPRSAANLLARHWLRLLYAFEVFAIAGGTLLGREGVSAFGWTALGITFALHLLVFLLHGLMRERGGMVRKLVAVAVAAVLALAALGGVYVARHLRADLRQWWAAATGSGAPPPAAPDTSPHPAAN